MMKKKIAQNNDYWSQFPFDEIFDKKGSAPRHINGTQGSFNGFLPHIPNEFTDQKNDLPGQRMARPSHLFECEEELKEDEFIEPAPLRNEIPLPGRSNYPLIHDPTLEDFDVYDAQVEECLGTDEFEQFQYGEADDFIDEMLPPEALLEHYADEPFQKKPLSKNIIDSFQVETVSRKDLGVACSICYMDYKIGDKVMKLNCKHKFHPDCVKKWFEKSHICPNCRAEQK